MAVKVRIGNDIAFTWRLNNSDGTPYEVPSGDIASVALVTGAKNYYMEGFTVDGNEIAFTFYGKDQKITGMYDLKLTVNDKKEGMLTYDVKGVLQLMAHSWETGGEDADGVTVKSVELNSTIGSTISEDDIPSTIARVKYVNTLIENIPESYSKDETDRMVQLLSAQDRISLLAVAPTMEVRGDGTETKVICIDHPLIDEPDAEVVLMRYRQRNTKYRKAGKPLYRNARYHRPKKGFCICSGEDGTSFFKFTGRETALPDLQEFILDIGIKCVGIFGIALRIPNPDYTGPKTIQGNAVYKGSHECLWSRVLHVAVNDSVTEQGIHYIGIGLVSR